ncbi:MAG: dienelactone hydrolase family protein [Sedimentisphaerales bacterium]|nr:dienelactone hydrolase family protein [Sedimentisphaerales bacterium]
MTDWKAQLTALLVVALLGGSATAQDPAVQRLNESPRHHEWVGVKYGDRTVQTLVVFPEVKDNVPAVLIIHENVGLTDWVRSVADRIAEAGYIAVAPDLLSGMGPDGGKTSDFPSTNAARDALYKLPPDQVTADLRAVADRAAKLPGCSGKLAVGGFCWGGSQTFRFATNRPTLKAAYVFYGTAPTDPNELKKIGCPVYGFYGGSDARVTSTTATTARQMLEAGKTYEPIVYEGAGHAFMRSGEQAEPDNANRKAHDAAWKRWLSLLKKL